MVTVADLTRWLEGFAPARLAEPWDNVGLLWGDPSAGVERVMTCLTVTSATAREAVEGRAGLVVSHHPILFKAAKRVVAGGPDGFLWDLARSGVSVASPHTAFDNTVGGINDGLARRLGLVDVGPLRATPGPPSFKVVVFTPEGDAYKVLDAAFRAGAGRAGAYAECSFRSPGEGRFRPLEGANPAVGRLGELERVAESRVEFLCPSGALAGVLDAVRSAHPYEEPAVDVFPRQNDPVGPGVGRLGTLPSATTLSGFADSVRRVLEAPGLQTVGGDDHPVRRVAVVCGAGDDFVADAARAGADVLLTGEARFHRALEAGALGVGLVVAGHHATERPGVEDLAARISGAFPGLEVWASRSEEDPLRSVPPGSARGPTGAQP